MSKAAQRPLPHDTGPTALDLGRIKVRPLSGEEHIRNGDSPLPLRLRDFWRWSHSDLVSNATRGVFAEFLVACALGIPLDGVRDEWAPFDLTTPDGTRVEVKSAAYLQSWSQRRLSAISFRTCRSRAWSADTNTLAGARMRHADVYVFALLAHTDKATVDPLDVCQWQFFVVPTTTINERTRSQHSITLPSLRAMTSALRFDELRAAVEAIALGTATD